MSKRPQVFLNGAPVWYPLLGVVQIIAVSAMGHLPVTLLAISGLVLVANLVMLLSCRSATTTPERKYHDAVLEAYLSVIPEVKQSEKFFSRWLGRMKSPYIGLVLSELVSLTDLCNIILFDAAMTPNLGLLTLITFCLISFSSLVFFTKSAKQRRLAKVVALLNQMYPEKSSLMLEEDHATRVNRLFEQAIGIQPSIVDRNG
jgi:hypothetical protein